MQRGHGGARSSARAGPARPVACGSGEICDPLRGCLVCVPDQLYCGGPTANDVLRCNGQGTGEGIYVMQPDGSGLTAITPPDTNERDPAWSPDGTKIAFSSDRTGSQQVHVVRLDQAGYPTTVLTTGPSNSSEPSLRSTHIS